MPRLLDSSCTAGMAYSGAGSISVWLTMPAVAAAISTGATMGADRKPSASSSTNTRPATGA